jgi:hypothetical protein
MTIKIKKDLRHLFGPVRDQGQRPTCLAFAASDTHAALRGAWEPLSCEYIFFHAQRRAGRTAKDGATLPSMLEALRQDGQPHEAGWPALIDNERDFAAILDRRLRHLEEIRNKNLIEAQAEPEPIEPSHIEVKAPTPSINFRSLRRRI